MKCIDPWLLNNRRQCPVCKRYVFPNADDSDEENQRRATERTPLLQSNDENSAMILPRNTENGNTFHKFIGKFRTNDKSTGIKMSMDVNPFLARYSSINYFQNCFILKHD